MGAASIRIDQPANPTTPVGQPGRARDDLLIALPVTLRNSDNTDVLRWVWTMVDRPIGSTAVLSGTTSTQVTFTPDVFGSYLIRLAVDDGLAGQIDLKVAAVRNADGYRFPATGETAASVNWPDNDEAGWGKDVEELLRDAAGANTLAGVLSLSNTTGGTDIEMTNGDSIVGEDGGSISFAPTSGDIVLDGVIRSPDGVASPGDPLQIESGAGAGAGNPGGSLTIIAGPGDPAGGAGGAATFSGGPGGSTSGGGGATTVQGGSAVAGNSNGGAMLVLGGQAQGTGTPGDILIATFGAVSGNVPGSSIAMVAGDGSGTGIGGALEGTAGDGGSGAATGGPVSLAAGDGGVTSGPGGSVTFTAGDALGGNSLGGAASLIAGTGRGTQAGGQAKIQAGGGGATGDGGIALVQAGPGGATSGTGGLTQILGGDAQAATATGGGIEIAAKPGGSGVAIGGSISLTSGDGGGVSGNSGSINLTVGEVNSGTRGTIRFEASNVIIALLSYHSVRGSTARGSTNTLIYRWSSVVENEGTDIVYTDSATAGGSWAIAVDGIYAVSFSIDAGHNGFIAIKKAAAVSNTYDATDIMVAIESFTGVGVALAWTGYCAAGSDIWIATNTATNPTGTPVNNQRCSVTRVR